MRLVAQQGVQLVLEPAALDRAVDPAFLRRIRLPPPAAGPRRLVGRDRARARRAADRLVTLVVERVVGDLALAHVVPDLLLGPLGERVQLDHGAVIVVDLDLAAVRPRGPLVTAQARDPGVERVQVLRQRAHLAHVAAEEAQVDGGLEQVDAVLAGHARDLVGGGLDEIEVEAGIAGAEAVGELMCLVGEATRLDGEDLDLRVELVRHVDQHDAVDLERRRDRDPAAEALDAPLDHGLRLLAFELDRELSRLEFVQQFERAHSSASSRWRPFAGASPASSPSSSSLARRANDTNPSSGSRRSSQPAISPSTAVSSSSVGTRRTSGRPIRGSGPGEPRTRMSYACRRTPPSSRDVVPWKPMSPTQCCAQACGQPSRCSRSGASWVPKRSSSPSISRPRRVFVSAAEQLQCGSPVQALALPRTGLTSSEKPISSIAATASGTRSFGTPVTTKFCWRVSRTSPPKRSARSAIAIIW